MKMPDEPHTTRASESTSSPRASFVIWRSEAAIVSPPKGISSSSSVRTAAAAPLVGASRCAAATRTIRSGKRQRRKLNAIAFVSTATSRESRRPPARRSRARTDGAAPRARFVRGAIGAGILAPGC
jgi:hypothetical protein